MSTVLFVHDGPVGVSADGLRISPRFGTRFRDRYAEAGEHVTILARQRVVTDESRLVPMPEGVALSEAPDAKGFIKFWINHRKARKGVRALVRSHDVVVPRLPSQLGAWAFREARRAGKPLIVEFVACTWDSMKSRGILGALLAPWLLRKNRKIMRKAPFAVYVTERFLQERYPSNGEWISCSNVDIETGQEHSLASRLKRISEGSEEPVTLGTLGGLEVGHKNQESVLRAISELGHTVRTYKYRVAGPGDPARLRRVAESLGVQAQFEAVGELTPEQVVQFLDETDVYVQPSRMEGLPRAVIEALSRGCVVIGSTAGGIPELIPEKCLFDPSRADQLVALLRALPGWDWTAEAERNWKVAQKYDREVLQKRRDEFLKRAVGAVGTS